MPLTRRQWIKLIAGSGGSLLVGGCATGFTTAKIKCHERYHLTSPYIFPERAVELVENTTVIDMMGALGLNCEQYWFEIPYSLNREDADFIAQSGITIFHLSPGLPRDDAHGHAVEFINSINTAVQTQPQYLIRINGITDIEEVKRSGKTGCLIGLQNSSHFRTVDDVDKFWQLGQRVSQITQNERNALGSGAREMHDNGLTAFGAQVIQRMNRLGMAVDVSHCGDRTTLDAIAASDKPVLITHANCRALNPGYQRNKTDEAIKKMAATGGVMGLTGLRAFVRGEEPTTIKHFLDHVDHIAQLTGIEHVGIGSDQGIVPAIPDLGANSSYYRGLPKDIREFYRFREKSIVDGLNHSQRIYAITNGLLQRGYSDSDIQGVLGLNFNRALGEIWS